MFNFIIIVLTLIILQLFVFKFPIYIYVKKQINKITGKIELLELKNTRFYDETKLLKELDLTEAKELYQLIISLSKSPTLTKEQVVHMNKAIIFLNELILEIIELMQKDIRVYNYSGWTVYYTSLTSSHEFNFYKENLQANYKKLIELFTQDLKNIISINVDKKFNELKNKYALTEYSEFDKVKHELFANEDCSNNLELVHLVNLIEKDFIKPYSEIKDPILKEKADKQIEEVIQFLQNKAQTINKYSLANNTTESLLAYNEQFIKQIKIHY